MTCASGKRAVFSACPETWVVIGLGAAGIAYWAIYMFIVRPNQDRITRRFLKWLRVKHPEKMALYAKQFLPIIWFLSFIALAWLVISVRGIQSNRLVEGSVGIASFGVFFLVVLQKVIFPSGGVHGPEVLLMDMFDEGNWIIAEDPTGHGTKRYEGRVENVDLHSTTLDDICLGEITLPNKVMVHMVIRNLDRAPFHFHRIPIEGDVDLAAVKAASIGTGDTAVHATDYIVKLNTRDENWYNRKFRSALKDGIGDGQMPIRLIHEIDGPALYIPVREHKHGLALVNLLISTQTIKVRSA